MGQNDIHLETEFVVRITSSRWPDLKQSFRRTRHMCDELVPDSERRICHFCDEFVLISVSELVLRSGTEL